MGYNPNQQRPNMPNNRPRNPNPNLPRNPEIPGGQSEDKINPNVVSGVGAGVGGALLGGLATKLYKDRKVKAAPKEEVTKPVPKAAPKAEAELVPKAASKAEAVVEPKPKVKVKTEPELSLKDKIIKQSREAANKAKKLESDLDATENKVEYLQKMKNLARLASGDERTFLSKIIPGYTKFVEETKKLDIINTWKFLY